jgi:hypothetical protein
VSWTGPSAAPTGLAYDLIWPVCVSVTVNVYSTLLVVGVATTQ